jgi:phosphotransferase system HPr (HPr) family protein
VPNLGVILRLLESLSQSLANINGTIGKSIMSVMMLAASQGTELMIEVEGDDETQALQAIRSLIDDYFGEGE